MQFHKGKWVVAPVATGFKYLRSFPWMISDRVQTKVRFDNTVWHEWESGAFNRDTFGSTFTCVTPGIYLFTAHVKWAASAINRRNIGIYKNPGSGNFFDYGEVAAAAMTAPAGIPRQSCGGVAVMTAGETIAMGVFQDSGAFVNIDIATFSAVRVGTI